MSKFELSIAENYVQGWGIVEAIREFFQNAVDQQSLVKGNDMFFKYDEKKETLYIGNKSSILEAKTLLLGTSSKSNDSNSIGQFGEGYKIATLVAIREGKKVIFYNYGKKEVWKPRMVKSRKYGANVLTFFTEKFIWRKVPDNYLTIEIQGITQEEYKRIVESNLHLQKIKECKQTSYGRILMDEKYKGQIYVNGLFVKKIDMDYGYDILPRYLKLDRDRKMVEDLDIQWLTSRMWDQASGSTSKQVISLAKNNSSDVKFICNIEIEPDEAKEEYEEFLKEHGSNAVPVSNNDEVKVIQAQYKNVTPVFVSESYKKILKESENFQIKAEKKAEQTMIEKLLIWIAPIREKLTCEEEEEFDKIIKEEKEDVPF